MLYKRMLLTLALLSTIGIAQGAAEQKNSVAQMGVVIMTNPQIKQEFFSYMNQIMGNPLVKKVFSDLKARGDKRAAQVLAGDIKKGPEAFLALASQYPQIGEFMSSFCQALAAFITEEVTRHKPENSLQKQAAIVVQEASKYPLLCEMLAFIAREVDGKTLPMHLEDVKALLASAREFLMSKGPSQRERALFERMVELNVKMTEERTSKK